MFCGCLSRGPLVLRMPTDAGRGRPCLSDICGILRLITSKVFLFVLQKLPGFMTNAYIIIWMELGWELGSIRESKSLSDCKCFEYDSSESLQNIQKIDSRLFHGDLIFAITFTYKIKTLRRNYIRCCLLFQSFLSAKTLIKKLHVNTIFENFVRLEKQTNTVCPI